jgi:hypothetical protein
MTANKQISEIILGLCPENKRGILVGSSLLHPFLDLISTGCYTLTKGELMSLKILLAPVLGGAAGYVLSLLSRGIGTS